MSPELSTRALEGLPGAIVLVVDEELRVLMLSGGGLAASGLDRDAIVGAPLGAVGFENDEMVAEACRAALAGRRVTVDARLVPSARRYSIRVTRIEPTVEAGPAALLLWQRPTEASDEVDELRMRAADLEAIADAARALARSFDSAEARRTVCDAAMRIARSDVAALLEPDPDGSALTVSAGTEDGLVGLVEGIGDGSPAADAFSSGVAIHEPHLPARPRSGFSESGIASVLWHPVSKSIGVRGVLALGWRTPRAHVPARVGTALEMLVAEAAVAMDRAAALDRLTGLARTDPLTALSNRRAWEDELAREIARASRDATPLALALVDLDGFKDYNDRWGHPAGDRLLMTAAARWRRRLRVTDILARIGGDEFAIAMPACELAEATILAERLRVALPSGVSCSIGVTEWIPGESPDGLLGRADEALYAAKSEGRDQTWMSDPGPIDRAAPAPR